jgi:hypothetical protein
MINEGTYSTIEVYKSKNSMSEEEKKENPYYLETSYDVKNNIIASETLPKGAEFIEINKDKLDTIEESAIYYVYSTTTLTEYERYDKIRQDLLFASDNGVTYVKVDTETAEPNVNTTYYIKENNWQNASGYIYNSGTRYF